MNVMKWIRWLASVAIIMLLTGCLTLFEEEAPDGSEAEDQPLVTTPVFEVQENYYQGLSPFVPSQTRGRLYHDLSQFRLDADRLDLGLLEVAQQFFPLDEYLFQEGQLITQNELSSWLRVESDTNPTGLNPADQPDPVLVHILEHNYVSAEDGVLDGVVIGLSLSPVYHNEETGIRSSYTDDELINHGQRMADNLAVMMRNKAPGVPIVIALYRLELLDQLRPGAFLSVGQVDADRAHVRNWQTKNEIYFVFPSAQLRQNYPELSRQYQNLRERVRDYFPHHVSMIGQGRFIDESLSEFTLEVTTEFASKTEVIQLTQFIGGELIQSLPEQVHINVYLSTFREPQSVLVRPAEGEVMMHVYR